MSVLLGIERAGLAYGLQPLLDEASLTVDRGERIGLIGRNGTGKSSLLGVITGRVALDEGTVRRDGGLRVVLVEQEPDLPQETSLLESLLARAAAQALIDDGEPWRLEARLREFLQRFGLDAERGTARLSGGEQKRAALALALASSPDLLLLDEPTNHLDIDGIELLEELLPRVSAAIVITHDRSFLDRFATRIVELDRGLLRSFPGNFAAYTARKAEQLATEETAARKFDAFWAQEEVWIRQGIKARRTRNEGRVRRLEQLRSERAERRERIGKVRLRLDAGARSGKLVAELEGVGKQFDGRHVVRDLSLRVLRGDRIGLIGPNGAGKSTLIRLILGQLVPDTGTVRLGSGLEVAYFDQLREQLDPQKTIIETISPGSEWIETAGQRRHVISYLGDFLFAPQRASSPVGTLSGGERNRLLLARLFARPANLLVLDEPTNDLDIESLELLEETLQSYAGTLLLVTHDRTFLDNVVTQTLVAEGDGHWQEYAGGYTDWLAQRPPPPADAVPAAAAPPARVRVESRSPAAARRLGFREQRELAELPVQIEALEQEQATLLAGMASASVDELHAAALRAAAITEELETAFTRWSELEERASGA